MVCSLSASWDRIGDVTEIVIDYVSLDEFSSAVEKLQINQRETRIWAAGSTWLNKNEALAIIPIKEEEND